jgi:hypothetical protein
MLAYGIPTDLVDDNLVMELSFVSRVVEMKWTTIVCIFVVLFKNVLLVNNLLYSLVNNLLYLLYFLCQK